MCVINILPYNAGPKAGILTKTTGAQKILFGQGRALI